MWRRLNKNTGRLDMAPCKYGHSEDTNKLYICLHLHDAEIQNHLLICAARCVQANTLFTNLQIHKFTDLCSVDMPWFTYGALALSGAASPTSHTWGSANTTSGTLGSCTTLSYKCKAAIWRGSHEQKSGKDLNRQMHMYTLTHKFTHTPISNRVNFASLTFQSMTISLIQLICNN